MTDVNTSIRETLPLQRRRGNKALPGSAAERATLTTHVRVREARVLDPPRGLPLPSPAPPLSLPLPSSAAALRLRGGNYPEKRKFGVAIGPLLLISHREARGLSHKEFWPWKGPVGRRRDNGS